MMPFAEPVVIFSGYTPTFVLYGLFIGTGACLMSLGPRYLPSAEVSLLILLESVLAPLLVWAWIGEHPSQWALARGVIVIGALLVSNLIALRRLHYSSVQQWRLNA